MPDEISVTRWIEALRNGDQVSAGELWNCYFERLMRFARSRMRTLPTSVYDEEDAAISTFRVLCDKLQAGEYPDLANRDEFWRLMLMVVVRKISRRIDYESAAKRAALTDTHYRVDESLAAAREKRQVAMEYEAMLSKLNDPKLERVAILKLHGYTHEEIANKIGRTKRTVQRMLDLIRDCWRDELDALS